MDTDNPPAKTPSERIRAQFRADTCCMHDLSAWLCILCRREDWRYGLVRKKSPAEEQRTVGDVADAYLSDGRIGSVEIIQAMINGRRAKPRSQRHLAITAGMIVATAYLGYKMGKTGIPEKLVLKLWTSFRDRNKRNGPASSKTTSRDG